MLSESIMQLHRVRFFFFFKFLFNTYHSIKDHEIKIDTMLIYVTEKEKIFHTLSSFKLPKAPRHSTKNVRWRSISVP